MTDLLIALPDGRKVQVEEYGDPSGTPALWFHGGFSSRLEASFLDAPARELGVRLLSLDRPGVGGSDPHPGRSITGYAADVEAVMDNLGIDEAAVGGLSNGGMYAMAVASALPDRVLRVVPVNSTTPVADAAAVAVLPAQSREAYANLARDPEAVAARVAAAAEPDPAALEAARAHNPDAHLLDDPQTRAAWERNTAEVLRQPSKDYVVSEITLSTSPWGFDHRAVPHPVTLVSGELDAGLAYAKVWAQELPHSRLVTLPGGHMGMLAPAFARVVVAALAAPNQGV
jgi:pimeloyl-ACP methyl ester carboxylesterase